MVPQFFIVNDIQSNKILEYKINLTNKIDFSIINLETIRKIADQLENQNFIADESRIIEKKGATGFCIVEPN